MAEPHTTTIALVAFPGMELLDLAGPLQVFATLGMMAPQVRCAVVAEQAGAMATDSALQVVPEQSFADLPDPDVVLVVGGLAPAMKAMGDPAIRAYLQAAASRGRMVGGVCTGALILAAAGLLEGREATTHWAFARQLEALGARYVRRRWVEDGPFITSAGVSAGIDMALHLSARLTDEATARAVQIALEYQPQPPLGDIDWDRVDPAMFAPVVAHSLAEGLADLPELRARLAV